MAEYVEDLKRLDAQSVHHIAHDGCGGRVLEQFIKNPEIIPKAKKLIAEKLKGQWVQLVMSSSGSFLVEACFDFAVSPYTLSLLSVIAILSVQASCLCILYKIGHILLGLENWILVSNGRHWNEYNFRSLRILHLFNIWTQLSEP